MNYNIISTGSQGNAVVLNNCILIDCGVPFISLKEVYKNLKLVLLTHIHSDHFKKSTITALADSRPTLRFGCCEWLVKDLVKCGVSKRNIDVYAIGKIYDYRVFKISPIKLYHDVPQCGYRVFSNGEKAIYCTDTFTLEGIRAKDYDLYLIEANYEEEEMQKRIQEKVENGEYCYELRVLNRHLSKEQADKFLYENMGAKGEYKYLHEHKGESENE